MIAFAIYRLDFIYCLWLLLLLLQLAVKTSNLDMVKVLLPMCQLEHLDYNSNSVFHYASITNKEMINVSLRPIVVKDEQL